ncbi:D-Tyr-tRNATyr deacylase [Cryptosporidium ubiquitum]|uniref:D-aminoacyl-tRNA deacylase n=1 Tax=Cryptosporidium ubiquitum TaxID=857276 RepID=A0A1J4MP01_9CRYT|nr:D-Tyr-tRNATyr deacylase [Cryptosporidium ubiquitum]OII75179.1 D-Tyr-tRNATyr deacylase [Cryptosporidium ubiquitum]
MRVVLQKVKSASVKVNDQVVSSIGPGLLLLVGIRTDDVDSNSDYFVRKCLSLRLWSDESNPNSSNPWKLSVKEKDFEIMVVSQFTLYGHVKNGSKPDFHNAMKGKDALIIFNEMVEKFKKSHNPDKIKTGCFGEEMEVSLVNDGPVTLILENNSKSDVSSDRSSVA